MPKWIYYTLWVTPSVIIEADTEVEARKIGHREQQANDLVPDVLVSVCEEVEEDE